MTGIRQQSGHYGLTELEGSHHTPKEEEGQEEEEEVEIKHNEQHEGK